MTTTTNTPNLILVGFMGSGKTVIGRQIARLLNYDFADTDEEIRQVTGLDLVHLFRKHGEIRFRSEERIVIQKLTARKKLVIACGGSLQPQQSNLALLKENGWFVLLTASPTVIQERLARKQNRLLVHGRPGPDAIAQTTASWEQIYQPFIDCRVDSGSMSVEETATYISKAYQERFPGSV